MPHRSLLVFEQSLVVRNQHPVGISNLPLFLQQCRLHKNPFPHQILAYLSNNNLNEKNISINIKSSQKNKQREIETNLSNMFHIIYSLQCRVIIPCSISNNPPRYQFSKLAKRHQ
ncbi:unnamed protein product [Ilex paraguariensis]|uniref:Uncharacterized protein n=1 Tax=Ilex paraguariensis TaxID=185542 RepID=A0ABC8RU31_9AQUA